MDSLERSLRERLIATIGAALPWANILDLHPTQVSAAHQLMRCLSRGQVLNNEEVCRLLALTGIDPRVEVTINGRGEITSDIRPWGTGIPNPVVDDIN